MPHYHVSFQFPSFCFVFLQHYYLRHLAMKQGGQFKFRISIFHDKSNLNQISNLAELMLFIYGTFEETGTL